MSRYIMCANKRAGNCHGCRMKVGLREGYAIRMVPGMPWSLLCNGCYAERVLRQGVLI